MTLTKLNWFQKIFPKHCYTCGERIFVWAYITAVESGCSIYYCVDKQGCEERAADKKSAKVHKAISEEAQARKEDCVRRMGDVSPGKA